MSEIAIPVAEAARDFLRLLEAVEARREPATLFRDGEPVARLVPLPRPAATCLDLAERWERMTRLPADEAEAFARDLDEARTNLPPLSPSCD